jgi:hypothetical protein
MLAGKGGIHSGYPFISQSFIKCSLRLRLSLVSNCLSSHSPLWGVKNKKFKKKFSNYLFMFLFPGVMGGGDFGIPKRLWLRDEGVRGAAAVLFFYLKCGFWRLGFLMIRFLWFI